MPENKNYGVPSSLSAISSKSYIDSLYSDAEILNGAVPPAPTSSGKLVDDGESDYLLGWNEALGRPVYVRRRVSATMATEKTLRASDAASDWRLTKQPGRGRCRAAGATNIEDFDRELRDLPSKENRIPRIPLVKMGDDGPAAEKDTLKEVTHVISPEGEVVPFSSSISTRTYRGGFGLSSARAGRPIEVPVRDAYAVVSISPKRRSGELPEDSECVNFDIDDDDEFFDTKNYDAPFSSFTFSSQPKDKSSPPILRKATCTDYDSDNFQAEYMDDLKSSPPHCSRSTGSLKQSRNLSRLEHRNKLLRLDANTDIKTSSIGLKLKGKSNLDLQNEISESPHNEKAAKTRNLNLNGVKKHKNIESLVDRSDTPYFDVTSRSVCLRGPDSDSEVEESATKGGDSCSSSAGRRQNHRHSEVRSATRSNLRRSRSIALLSRPPIPKTTGGRKGCDDDDLPRSIPSSGTVFQQPSANSNLEDAAAFFLKTRCRAISCCHCCLQL
mmetsp:Transcript_36432/g.85176  ORF Transcript_36432/g.85176 Transcript_36432/m.85176 type:complete len:498 (-) Transcript_36432:618-2111(-)